MKHVDSKQVIHRKTMLNMYSLYSYSFPFSVEEVDLNRKGLSKLAFLIIHEDHWTGVIPGLMMLLGKIIMNIAETQRSKLPSSSSRNPNHSLDPLLWKSIRRLASTRLTFSWLNISCFLKQRIVITPEMLSEKWWITGAFVIESSRVNSRDVAR